MKKVFALMSIVAMFSMVACGPAKHEDKAADEQAKKDSIEAAAKAEAEMEAASQPEVDETPAMDTTAMDTTAKVEEAAPAAH